MNIGICDDSKIDLHLLSGLISDYEFCSDEEVNIITFSSGEDVLRYCRTSNNREGIIDILFLDVEMGEMSGLDCKRLLEPEPMVWRICFTTSHGEYVFDSFSTKTVGYLIKPVDKEKLFRIIDVIQKEKSKCRTMSYIGVDGERHKLFLDEILYIRADGSYVVIQTNDRNNREIIVSKKLGQVEEELAGASFARSHKSFLVNLAYVKNVGQEISLRYCNDKIPIGRAYKNPFNNRVDAYVREIINSRAI